jgi:hypothetical protein
MFAAAGCDLAVAVIAFVVLRPDSPIRSSGRDHQVGAEPLAV